MLKSKRQEKKRTIVHMAHYKQPAITDYHYKVLEGDRYFLFPKTKQGVITLGSVNVASLCGKVAFGYNMVFTAKQLIEVPLDPDSERMCKLCKRSLKYPLLILSAL